LAQNLAKCRSDKRLVINDEDTLWRRGSPAQKSNLLKSGFTSRALGFIKQKKKPPSGDTPEEFGGAKRWFLFILGSTCFDLARPITLLLDKPLLLAKHYS
jgi:hypothetical protein